MSCSPVVTANLKDFPSHKMPSGIEVLEPSEFAANTVAVSPAAALRAVVALTERRRKPAGSVDEFLAILRSTYSMHEAVDLIDEIR